MSLIYGEEDWTLSAGGVDGISTRYYYGGCHIRPIFQLIPDYWDEWADATKWPDPYPYHRLEEDD